MNLSLINSPNASSRKLKLLCIAAFCLVLASPWNASAATITINGFGQVTGATDVLVGATLYDVVFSEASCVTAYSGCNELSDFIFQTSLAAQAASQALLDQVFLDLPPAGPANDFDSIPSLTFGCTPTSSFTPTTCTVVTPYHFIDNGSSTASGISINTTTTDSIGTVEFNGSQAFSDGNLNRSRTLAVWTLSAPLSVPDQASSMLLLAIAVAGISVARLWS